MVGMIDENGLYPKLLRAIARQTYPDLIQVNVCSHAQVLDGRVLREVPEAADVVQQDIVRSIDEYVEKHHLRRVSVIDIEVRTDLPDFIRDHVVIRGTCRATGMPPSPQSPRKPLWGRCRAKLRRWARRAFRR